MVVPLIEISTCFFFSFINIKEIGEVFVTVEILGIEGSYVK